MNAPLDPKKIAQAAQSSAQQYDAGDLNDAHCLAATDLNWAYTAMSDIRSRFLELKESLQKDHGERRRKEELGKYHASNKLDTAAKAKSQVFAEIMDVLPEIAGSTMAREFS